MSELVTILKERNIVGQVVADKRRPPFRRRRPGWLLRWWGREICWLCGAMIPEDPRRKDGRCRLCGADMVPF